jgi:hypothetical protein
MWTIVLRQSTFWYSVLIIIPDEEKLTRICYIDGTKHEWMVELAVSVVGACLAVLVVVFGDRGNNPPARLARCIMGFLVAVVWIMAIADEVVNVLQVRCETMVLSTKRLTCMEQTFGYIFGLSHAIIGLTIFAMGNSLADLVANISVAVCRYFRSLTMRLLTCISVGVRPRDGLFRVLRRTHAQHAPRRRLVRHIHHLSERRSAVRARVLAHAACLLRRPAGHTHRLGGHGPAERLPPYPSMGCLFDRVLYGHFGSECGGGDHWMSICVDNVRTYT